MISKYYVDGVEYLIKSVISDVVWGIISGRSVC